MTLLWQGTKAFDAAKTAGTTHAAVRQGARVGDVARNAIFLHPPARGKATLEFAPTKVRTDGGSRVFLLCYAGMSEGIPWDDKERKPDGARFYVSIGGKEAAQTWVSQSRWEPMSVDLGRFEAGEREITIQLATDSGPNGNSNYDWALFGEPVLIALSEESLPANAATPGVSGILIVSAKRDEGALVVEGLNAAGKPAPNAQVRTPAKGLGLSFVSFDFTSAGECSAWRWRAEGLEADTAWAGNWQPQLEIQSAGPSRAVILDGEPVSVRIGVANTGMGALIETDDASLECEGRRQPVPRIAPDETKVLEFVLGPKPAGTFTVSYEYRVRGTVRKAQAGPFYIWPRLPGLPDGQPSAPQSRDLGDGFLLLENPSVRWLVNTRAPGMATLMWVWDGKHWETTGSASPLLEIVDSEGGGDLRLTTREARGRPEAGLQAEGEWKSPQGAMRVALEMKPAADSVAMEIVARAKAEQDTVLGAVRGPAVHAGDRGTGARKGIAIFPGLEYLEGDEASSSTRDLAPPLNLRVVPHKFKITAPMMMVETRPGGPVMALVWDPRQKWHPDHVAPAACFASPNFVEQQDNHLMQLFVPSVTDRATENQRSGAFRLEAGKEITLRQYVAAGRPAPDATGAFAWLDKLAGLPEPEPYARNFEDETALCRHGFMKTVWDETEQKSLHIVGGSKANSPGFAALLLMDARAVARGDEKRRIEERVKLIAEKTQEEKGAGGLAEGTLCHIMGGEFPYHWGQMPAALAGLRTQAYGSLSSQEADGGWGFYPDERRSVLGERGARVSGICARNAYILAKYAAISGDPTILDALKKALARLRQFRVPRGAQGWECPIMQPDVLASAYAVRAYVWAHMATADTQWLDDARFWARTGLPFQYTWDDGQRPGMRYASIPVFGSTFYTHSWIGLPVQWCGLVYAYALQELMRFDANPWWRKQAEGMTVSATYQQWPMDNEKLAGSYPDSWGEWFTRRNPAHINPEDIAVNLLALKGLDPGLRSTTTPLGGGLVHITAPADLKASIAGETLRVEMKYLPNETFYATIAPVAVANEGLALREQLGAGETGWAYDPRQKILAAGIKADAQGLARIEVSGLTYSAPETPRAKTGWEFDKDIEGWSAAHSCEAKAQDGALVLTVTGPDPYAVSGPAAIAADKDKQLRLRVRMTAGNQVGLFWCGNRSPNWGPDKHVTLAVPGDGQWREITFDLTNHPLWTGQVMQIRLDPEPADLPAGAVLAVDWIRCGIVK